MKKVVNGTRRLLYLPIIDVGFIIQLCCCFQLGCGIYLQIVIHWAALCVDSNVNPHSLMWSTTYAHLTLRNIHASKHVNYLINLLYSNAALLIAVHYPLQYLVFDWYDNRHKWVTCNFVRFLADNGNLLWVGYAVTTTISVLTVLWFLGKDWQSMGIFASFDIFLHTAVAYQFVAQICRRKKNN